MFSLPSQTVYIQFIDPISNLPINLINSSAININLIGKNFTNTPTNVVITNAIRGQITAIVSNIKPDIYEVQASFSINGLPITPLTGLIWTVYPLPDIKFGSRVVVKNYNKNSMSTPLTSSITLIINDVPAYNINGVIDSGVFPSSTASIDIAYIDGVNTVVATNYAIPVIPTQLNMFDTANILIPNIVDNIVLEYSITRVDNDMTLFLKTQRPGVY